MNILYFKFVTWISLKSGKCSPYVTPYEYRYFGRNQRPQIPNHNYCEPQLKTRLYQNLINSFYIEFNFQF